MAFFRHRYSLLRTKVCRHCGQTFETESPAQKTCKRPACVVWSNERKKEQNRKSKIRLSAIRRRLKGEAK